MAAAAHIENMPHNATHAAWDAAYTTYQARKALCDADENFGALKKAQQANAMAELALKEEFGRNWRQHPDAKERYSAIYDALVEAERRSWTLFGEPADAARAKLLTTPAPDLAAVQIKVDILSAYEFSIEEIGRPGSEIIADDVERLTGIAA